MCRAAAGRVAQHEPVEVAVERHGFECRAVGIDDLALTDVHCELALTEVRLPFQVPSSDALLGRRGVWFQDDVGGEAS